MLFSTARLPSHIFLLKSGQKKTRKSHLSVWTVLTEPVPTYWGSHQKKKTHSKYANVINCKRIYWPKNASKVDADTVVLPWENHLWASWHGCNGGRARGHWCERSSQSWRHNAWGTGNRNDNSLNMYFMAVLWNMMPKMFYITFYWYIRILQGFKLSSLVFIYTSPLSHSQEWTVSKHHLPGAGELITGPTLLGDVKAAGNLICASPPYLITTLTEDLSLVFLQCECVNVSMY